MATKRAATSKTTIKKSDVSLDILNKDISEDLKTLVLNILKQQEAINNSKLKMDEASVQLRDSITNLDKELDFKLTSKQREIEQTILEKQDEMERRLSEVKAGYENQLYDLKQDHLKKELELKERLDNVTLAYKDKVKEKLQAEQDLQDSINKAKASYVEELNVLKATHESTKRIEAQRLKEAMERELYDVLNQWAGNNDMRLIKNLDLSSINRKAEEATDAYVKAVEETKELKGKFYSMEAKHNEAVKAKSELETDKKIMEAALSGLKETVAKLEAERDKLNSKLDQWADKFTEFAEKSKPQIVATQADNKK